MQGVTRLLWRKAAEMPVPAEVVNMMDQDAPSDPQLDFTQKDREVYLVKIPAQMAANWASCDFDDELGTLVFPSDPSKVRISQWIAYIASL